MKIVSYNVNGIRAAMGKGLTDYMQHEDADVYCLQEIKATRDVVDHSHFDVMKYKSFWQSAEKKGYSGVALFCKEEPKHVEYGCGNKLYDFEGRVIRADFEKCSVMSVYMPSGTTGEIRQEFKYGWLDFFFNYITDLKTKIPKLIVCGDYNICHRAIDIHDPKGNAQSSGFLPEEREWMEKFFNSGWTDSFRSLNPAPHNYTWWSFRANARNNNKGWRIDYCSVAESLKNNISESFIRPDAKHSDHCPTGVVIKI